MVKVGPLKMWQNFKYFGTIVTNQIFICREIKSRLNSGNTYYHLVQNTLSSSLLPGKVKITIYKNTILFVVLYGCETWPVTIREKSD
jgi:hypothetical protein